MWYGRRGRRDQHHPRSSVRSVCLYQPGSPGNPWKQYRRDRTDQGRDHQTWLPGNLCAPARGSSLSLNGSSPSEGLFLPSGRRYVHPAGSGELERTDHRLPGTERPVPSAPRRPPGYQRRCSAGNPGQPEEARTYDPGKSHSGRL